MAYDLIRDGVQINYRNTLGNTALHYCIMNKNIDAIKLLLSYHANPHLENAEKKDCCDLAKEMNINFFTELNNCP